MQLHFVSSWTVCILRTVFQKSILKGMSHLRDLYVHGTVEQGKVLHKERAVAETAFVWFIHSPVPSYCMSAIENLRILQNVVNGLAYRQLALNCVP